MKPKSKAAQEMAKMRAKSLSPARRSEIAKQGGLASGIARRKLKDEVAK